MSPKRRLFAEEREARDRVAALSASALAALLCREDLDALTRSIAERERRRRLALGAKGSPTHTD